MSSKHPERVVAVELTIRCVVPDDKDQSADLINDAVERIGKAFRELGIRPPGVLTQVYELEPDEKAIANQDRTLH